PAILNGESDAVKYQAHEQFKGILKSMLAKEAAFKYPFDQLKTISILGPSDKSFRIFNWNLPRADGTFEYFGLIHRYNKEYKKYEVHELVDGSEKIQGGDQKVLSAKNWYGAHYYSLIGMKKKNSKYYILLGWDGNNRMSNKKIVDVLSFGKAGQPSFGKGVLGTPVGYKNRLVFEYHERASMSVKFDPSEKTIVYDHLAGNTAAVSGVAEFQGPDGSFDALYYKRGKWQYIRDYDARNPKASKKKEYNDPE
ncbi:MAG: hypothetical protein JKX73_09340, partial [Flavobacteriales bacterium]|nr:hypothetical protein [Flavobacteriales bacterium]